MAQQIHFSFSDANLEIGDVLHVVNKRSIHGSVHTCFYHNGDLILQSYGETSRILLKDGYKTVFLGTVVCTEEIDDLVLEVVDLKAIQTTSTHVIPIFETR